MLPSMAIYVEYTNFSQRFGAPWIVERRQCSRKVITLMQCVATLNRCVLLPRI